MTAAGDHSNEVDQFIRDEIDSVPHLEALLLAWNSHPRRWSEEEMARALYLPPENARAILDDLVRRRLIATSEGIYYYSEEPERDRLIGWVDSAYRRELIRISRFIHSKPPAAVREFARAFRLKKERE